MTFVQFAAFKNATEISVHKLNMSIRVLLMGSLLCWSSWIVLTLVQELNASAKGEGSFDSMQFVGRLVRLMLVLMFGCLLVSNHK